MNSINWPAPILWVFIAQLVEHCSANAVGIPLKPPGKSFFLSLYFAIVQIEIAAETVTLFISFVFPQFTLSGTVVTIIYLIRFLMNNRTILTDSGNA